MKEKITPAVRFPLRPGRFAVVAAAVLGLAIGASITIFSLAYAAIWGTAPYAKPSRLFLVELSRSPGLPLSASEVARIRGAGVFAGVAYARGGQAATVGAGRWARTCLTARVSPNLLSVLGVRPLVGRTFTRREALSGEDHVALISYAFWRSAFGGRTGVVGQRILVGGRSYDIVGIMGRRFQFPGHTDLWTPAANPAYTAPKNGYPMWSVVVRLKPGMTAAVADQLLSSRVVRVDGGKPAEEAAGRFRLASLQEIISGPVRTEMVLLLSAVGLVLIIACANITGLLLSRNLGLRRELATRHALGASRWQLLRFLAREGVAICAAAGVLGYALANLGAEAMRRLAPPTTPGLALVGAGGPVLAFACGATLLATVATAVLPAWRVAGGSLAPFLNEGASVSKAALGSPRNRGLDLLAAGQVAVALILVAGTVLMIRSVVDLLRVNLGFQPSHVLAVGVDVHGSLAMALDRSSVVRLGNLLARIEAVPDVRSAAVANAGPMMGLGGIYAVVHRAAERGPAGLGLTHDEVVGGSYFSVLRIPVLQGRVFGPSDSYGAQPVAIVNASLARRMGGSTGPVGQFLNVGGKVFKIVGEVGDARDLSLESRPIPMVYLPLGQWPADLRTVLVRTSGNPALAAGALSRVIWNALPKTKIYEIGPLQDMIERSPLGARFRVGLLSLFALLALVLSGAGLASFLANAIAARKQEFGIRLALGAQQGQIVGMMVGLGMRTFAIGAVAGLVIAWLLAGSIGSLLYGVEPHDPATFAAACGILGAISISVCYIAARHASRCDPSSILRAQ